MEYFTDLAMWNGGRLDSWNTARAPGMGMSYMTRQDLPYYYTLYESFAAGDQYHQSTLTCTDPNRMHLFTGSNGLSVGQQPVVDNTEIPQGYNWTTFSEVLENAGVSWRTLKNDNDHGGWFDDDGNLWFSAFVNAKPGDPLYEKGVAPVDDLIEVSAGGKRWRSGALA